MLNGSSSLSDSSTEIDPLSLLSLPSVPPPLPFPYLSPTPINVYIGHLPAVPPSTTSAPQALVRLCGPILSYVRLTDPFTTLPKPFALVHFGTAEGALVALHLLNGRKWFGSSLVVRIGASEEKKMEEFKAKKIRYWAKSQQEEERKRMLMGNGIGGSGSGSGSASEMNGENGMKSSENGSENSRSNEGDGDSDHSKSKSDSGDNPVVPIVTVKGAAPITGESDFARRDISNVTVREEDIHTLEEAERSRYAKLSDIFETFLRSEEKKSGFVDVDSSNPHGALPSLSQGQDEENEEEEEDPEAVKKTMSRLLQLTDGEVTEELKYRKEIILDSLKKFKVDQRRALQEEIRSESRRLQSTFGGPSIVERRQERLNRELRRRKEREERDLKREREEGLRRLLWEEDRRVERLRDRRRERSRILEEREVETRFRRSRKRKRAADDEPLGRRIRRKMRRIMRDEKRFYMEGIIVDPLRVAPANDIELGDSRPRLPPREPKKALALPDDEEEAEVTKRPLRSEALLSKQDIDAANEFRRKQQADEAFRRKAREQLRPQNIVRAIPPKKDALFAFPVNWKGFDDHQRHITSKLEDFVRKKVAEYVGTEEQSLVFFILSKIRNHIRPGDLLTELRDVLKDVAEDFVVKVWKMLLFCIIHTERQVLLWGEVRE